MSNRYHKVLFFILISNYFLVIVSTNDQLNPYKVLGVPRNANDKQIRNAYRKMAKDWHPDKNKAPEAHEKFMQINQAYEILSDSERRSLYDDYGTTNEPRQGHHHRESYDSFFRDFEGFESFFGGGHGGGFRFNFNGNGDSRQHSRKSKEEEINKKIYDEQILPNSHTKPFLIYSYTEFCFSCMAIESLWQQFKQEVKNIGFGVGHSDASWNRELSRNLGISTVPSIVAVINGRVQHFRGDFNLKSLREFARKLIPSKLFKELTINNLNDSLTQSIKDNKVFSIFISTSNQLTLRYQMPCFQMVNSIQCAYIKLSSIDSKYSEYLKAHYSIEAPTQQPKQEMLVIFKENLMQIRQQPSLSNKPVYSNKINEFTYSQITQIFDSNKNLYLPRLSSLHHLYDLCPSWSNNLNQVSKKIFCIVFMSNSYTQSPPYLFDHATRVKLIKKIKSDDYLSKNAQFTIVYADIQTDFVERLVKTSRLKLNDKDNNKSIIDAKILLLKRLDDKYIQFDWLDASKVADNNDNNNEFEFVQDVKSFIRLELSDDKNRLQFKMSIPNFYEESSQSLISSILDYLQDVWDIVTDIYFWERLIGNSSYMMILICTILFIWLMMMFSSEKTNPLSANQRAANNNIKKESHSSAFKNSQQNSKSASANLSSLYSQRVELNNRFELVEMNRNNYNDLILNAPKGFRTVLLVVNQESKDQLIDLFTRVCSKYANKSYQLKFAYLHLNTFSGQKWYNELIFDKYKEIDQDDEMLLNGSNRKDSTSSSTNSTSSQNDSSEEDYEKIKSNQKLDQGCMVLAINSSKKYFICFNLKSANTYLNLKKIRKNDSKSDFLLEECFGFEQDQQDDFVIELSNWLDKFTEGICENKRCVKAWPKFN